MERTRDDNPSAGPLFVLERLNCDIKRANSVPDLFVRERGQPELLDSIVRV